MDCCSSFLVFLLWPHAPQFFLGIDRHMVLSYNRVICEMVYVASWVGAWCSWIMKTGELIDIDKSTCIGSHIESDVDEVGSVSLDTNKIWTRFKSGTRSQSRWLHLGQGHSGVPLFGTISFQIRHSSCVDVDTAWLAVWDLLLFMLLLHVSLLYLKSLLFILLLRTSLLYLKSCANDICFHIFWMQIHGQEFLQVNLLSVHASDRDFICLLTMFYLGFIVRIGTGFVTQ